MTNNRESLSKKLRFEIFKRDDFTCQYCGRTAEDVILEIDHITPVAKGGTNDEMNLVTACFDCNRGKGDRKLGDVIPRPDADLKYLETQQEIQELKRYQKAKQELDALHNQVADELQYTWCQAFDTDYAPKLMAFVKLIKQMPPDIIEKAIYITANNKNLYGSDRFKYMCGVAWKLIRGQDGE
jgi:CRISPR/Cas system Type II protein with McrA/HNH and RuvC-like nuclease domain